jgi:hypothetical protein
MRPTTSTAGPEALSAASDPATVASYAGEPEPGAAPSGASPACRVRLGGSRRILPVATEPKVASTRVVAVREAQRRGPRCANRAVAEIRR